MSANIGEYEAIERTIQYYLDGARSGRADDMRPAFHAGATMFGYIGPDLMAVPIEHLFEWHERNGAATGLKSHIASIDISESAATVRLELDNWTGLRFTDFFTLLKVDGQWKIINKTFHNHH